jgi:hypothetical protein
MEGGNRRYERVCVSHTTKDIRGEWYGRQFLTNDEAVFFKKMEQRTNQPMSVIMGGVRGLPRVAEFDECLMRQTMVRYSSQLKCELSALLTTITHEWPPNSRELRDEPIIVVFLMDGNFRDGESLGRFLDCYSRNEALAKQTFGSIDTQFFLKIDSIVNRPLRSSPDACILEIDRYQKGAHMIDLLRILGDDEASRTSAVIRMDNDWKNPDFDKWCILLTRKGAVKDGFRDPSGILIREKSLTSPTLRNKQLNKGPSYEDEGNIRFFDNTERGRSLSRDRSETSESDRDVRGRGG